jgi:hypothetical protein
MSPAIAFRVSPRRVGIEQDCGKGLAQFVCQGSANPLADQEAPFAFMFLILQFLQRFAIQFARFRYQCAKDKQPGTSPSRGLPKI